VGGNTSTARTGETPSYGWFRLREVGSAADAVPGPWAAARPTRPRNAPLPVPPLHPRGARLVDRWPLRSFLELGAYPTAVPCARLHAKHVLREWSLRDVSDSAELLVSELVTNAVRASPTVTDIAVVRLWLLSNKARLLIMVQDDSLQRPVRAELEADAEGGRGLLLVETVSERWDWYLPEGAAGKVVWCVLSGCA
jgi:anti-sigma regulatory factor (Ser/Thr protein kinase)